MTPEESSIFFDLLSGTASDTAVPYMDFLADPRAREWDEGLPITPRSRAEFLAEGLQEHARGCNLPIAECRLCHLCGLAIKRLWLSSGCRNGRELQQMRLTTLPHWSLR